MFSLWIRGCLLVTWSSAVRRVSSCPLWTWRRCLRSESFLLEAEGNPKPRQSRWALIDQGREWHRNSANSISAPKWYVLWSSLAKFQYLHKWISTIKQWRVTILIQRNVFRHFLFLIILFWTAATGWRCVCGLCLLSERRCEDWLCILWWSIYGFLDWWFWTPFNDNWFLLLFDFIRIEWEWCMDDSRRRLVPRLRMGGKAHWLLLLLD